MLEIRLLGSPQITLGGQEIHLNRRKSRALLYYLASHDQPINREQLLSVFWADTPRQSAQQTLRTTLHGLKKSLGPALLVEDERLSLSDEVEVDARRFASLLTPPGQQAANLQTALALYKGDFLEGFTLPDAPAFEEWVTIEQERYRRMAVRGLAVLSRHHEEAGSYPEALTSLERALSFNPLQEDLQRELIRLLYLAGDRPAAIQHYDTLRRLLDEELGVPPMLETRKLYDSILNDTLAAVPSKRAEPQQRKPAARTIPASNARAESSAYVSLRGILPFTGREKELLVLKDLAARQQTGRGSPLVLLEGEAGIGKSRLAGEFMGSLDVLQAAGSAHELEHSIPYQPVIEALRNLVAHPEWPAVRESLQIQPVWLQETSRLVPELSTGAGTYGEEGRQAASTSPADESRLWEGVHQFLRAAGRQKPVVFFIDDLQWADASTLALLSYLVRQGDAPVFYLAAARPALPRSPLAALLHNLIRSSRLERIPLERLSPEEVTRLAQHISPNYAYPLAGWLVQQSEGSPYILSELVRYGHENQILDTGGEVNLSALSGAPVVPYTIYSLTQSRLDRLSGPARRVLETGAVVGRVFEFEVVYRAAGLSETAALDALDELLASGLLAPASQGTVTAFYRFDHSLTLEVASREMGEARKRLLNRRVGEALQTVFRGRTDLVSGKIAFHFTQGGDPARAAPYAYRAGQQASGLAAWTEAVDFYEKALAGETSPERRRQILLALGEARFHAGETARASEHYREALALAKHGSGEHDEALLALATSLLTQSRFAEAISLAQQVRAEARPELAMQAQFVWGTALSLEGADLEAAAEHLNQAAQAAVSCSGSLHMAEIRFELGSVAAQQGDLQRAVEMYREALEFAIQAGEEGLQRRVLSYNNLAYHLHLLSDPAAKDHALAGLSLAQSRGFIPLQTYLLSTLGEIALAEGKLEEAERYFREGLALAERLSAPERIAGLTANLGLVAKERGHSDLAIHYLSKALARADGLGTRHLAAQIRIWLAPLLPPSEARAHLFDARLIAESGGRKRLLEEVERLEKQYF